MLLTPVWPLLLCLHWWIPSLPQPHLLLTLSLRTFSTSSVFSAPNMLIVFQATSSIISVLMSFRPLFPALASSCFQSDMFMMVAGHFYVDAKFFETVYPLTLVLFLASFRLEKSNHPRSKLLIFFFPTIITHWILAFLFPSSNVFPPSHLFQSSFIISFSSGHNNLLISHCLRQFYASVPN